MARMGVTFEIVAKAATELSVNKQNPTVDRVRKLIGTGSKSTIAKHLKRWRIQAELSENHGNSEVSDTIPDALMDLMKQFWRDFYRQQCADIAARQYLEKSQDQKSQTADPNTQEKTEDNIAIEQQILFDDTLHTVRDQLYDLKQSLQQQLPQTRNYRLNPPEYPPNPSGIEAPPSFNAL